MTEGRGRSVRFVVAFALVFVALVEIYTLLLAARTQRRLRDATLATARLRSAPVLAWSAGLSAPVDWSPMAERILRAGLASEVEVLEATGEPLFSMPVAAPVPHRLRDSELESLRQGQGVTVIAQAGPVARVLTYLPLAGARDGGATLRLVRLSAQAPELERDLLERQYGFGAHLAAVAFLVMAAGLLILSPDRSADRVLPSALDAYEEAMGRLRDRGQEMSREHLAERSRMEDELRERESMARAGEITAGIVHEVRNGLGTILGYARLIERNPDERERAGGIVQECATLESVIRRFVEFVRTESLSLGSFDPREMLRRVAEREGKARPGARLVLDLREVGSIVGDEEMLERAFENLVRNALEAVSEHGEVTLASRREGNLILISVADDGPGLPAELRGGSRPFATTKAGGLGLGLPFALKIVRLHGGTLRLLDGIPRGLTVEVGLWATGTSSGHRVGHDS